MKSEEETPGTALDVAPELVAGESFNVKPSESGGGGRRRSKRKEKALIAILIVAALVLPVWSIADLAYVSSQPTGREYSYSYHVRVSNVTSNFTLIVPIPVVDSGAIVSSVDFEDAQLGNLEIVDTAHGPGLRIRSDGPYTLTLHWHYDALRNSSDRVSDGCPLTSMTTLDKERSVVCSMSTGDSAGSAWTWSDAPGLAFDIEFERGWGIERTAESLLWPESDVASSVNNGFYSLTGNGRTEDGWSSCPVELIAGFITQ